MNKYYNSKNKTKTLFTYCLNVIVLLNKIWNQGAIISKILQAHITRKTMDEQHILEIEIFYILHNLIEYMLI